MGFRRKCWRQQQRRADPAICWEKMPEDAIAEDLAAEVRNRWRSDFLSWESVITEKQALQFYGSTEGLTRLRSFRTVYRGSPGPVLFFMRGSRQAIFGRVCDNVEYQRSPTEYYVRVVERFLRRELGKIIEAGGSTLPIPDNLTQDFFGGCVIETHKLAGNLLSAFNIQDSGSFGCRWRQIERARERIKEALDNFFDIDYLVGCNDTVHALPAWPLRGTVWNINEILEDLHKMRRRN